jgi:hypothetical protein
MRDFFYTLNIREKIPSDMSDDDNNGTEPPARNVAAKKPADVYKLKVIEWTDVSQSSQSPTKRLNIITQVNILCVFCFDFA